MDIFTTDYQVVLPEMEVVETLWQLHTLIVINSWFRKLQQDFVIIACTIALAISIPRMIQPC